MRRGLQYGNSCVDFISLAMLLSLLAGSTFGVISTDVKGDVDSLIGQAYFAC